jgi:hypothetical protein
MNTHNFKIFVEALEALPESIKNNNVNMASICISPTFVVIISPRPKSTL